MAEEKVHVNEADFEWKVGTSPKGRFEIHEKFISEGRMKAEAREQPSFHWSEAERVRASLRPFEVDIVKVSPGKRAWPRHYHSASWEYYIVLSGTGEMVQEKGTPAIPMVPGEHIIQPPGWIHTIANTGSEDLVYYVIANNPQDEHCYYPDSDKYAGAGAVYRPQKVEYWDGEEEEDR